MAIAVVAVVVAAVAAVVVTAVVAVLVIVVAAVAVAAVAAEDLPSTCHSLLGDGYLCSVSPDIVATIFHGFFASPLR